MKHCRSCTCDRPKKTYSRKVHLDARGHPACRYSIRGAELWTFVGDLEAVNCKSCLEYLITRGEKPNHHSVHYQAQDGKPLCSDNWRGSDLTAVAYPDQVTCRACDRKLRKLKGSSNVVTP